VIPITPVSQNATADITVERIRNRDGRALAKVLTLIENQAPGYEEVIRELHKFSGKAARIGITGQPGAGKSTLVAALATELRRRDRTVGILAVDPSSPFTKGALLGDRIRMQELIKDAGVFVRSIASRGQQGGLAACIIDAVTALDSFGMDVVLIETVGAGQDEVDIMRVAETVVVIEIPGAGDEVQSLKAGLLEIADIYVVNKADHSGANAVASQLKQLISLVAEQPWKVPVLKTIATRGDGVPALVEALAEHHAFLVESGALASKRQAEAVYQLRNLVQKKLFEFLDADWDAGGLLQDFAFEVAGRTLDPHTAAFRLIESADWQSLVERGRVTRNEVGDGNGP
jgi:LAO/AO transport system kinase